MISPYYYSIYRMINGLLEREFLPFHDTDAASVWWSPEISVFSNLTKTQTDTFNVVYWTHVGHRADGYELRLHGLEAKRGLISLVFAR